MQAISFQGAVQMRRMLFVLTVLVLSPVRMSAQDVSFFSGIFKNFHSVTIYSHTSSLQGASGLTGGEERCVVLDMCGGGVEFLIDLDTLTGGRVQLGLGASYLRGFRLQDTTLELRASMRSFPTLSGYFTGWNVLGSKAVTGYVGLSFGLSDLWNAQVYDSVSREITLKAQTFDYGIVGGLHWNVGPIGGPFVEGGYKRRHFTSVDWGRDSLPTEDFRRSLDLSGWNVALGWEFELRQSPPKKERAALPGRWRLVKVDGDSLPFVASQTILRGDQSSRVQWLDGSLVFIDDGDRYELTVLVREETLAGANVVAIGPTRRLPESATGTYEEGTSIVVLRPVQATPPPGQPVLPQPSPLTATWVGNDLLIEYGGHYLTFSPG